MSTLSPPVTSSPGSAGTTDFIPDPVYDWSSPPDPPTPAPTPTPTAPPVKRKGHKRPAGHHLTRSVSSAIIDRLEAAVGAGVIDLISDNDRPTEVVELTTAELALLLRILLPEEYRAPVRAPAPTTTAPATAERIEVYMQRVKRRRKLFDPRDAKADGPGKGLAITQRGNGSGHKVLGWAGGPGQPDPADAGA